MKKIVFGALGAALALAMTGCASNSIVGDGGVPRVDQFFGDVGIWGSDKNVTILRGSKVIKLSLLGHNNTVMVEDGVSLSKIEFWGKGNTVSIAEDLIIRTSEVGANQIIRRPRELHPPPEWSPYAVPVEPVPEPEPDIARLRPPPTFDLGRPVEPDDTESVVPVEPEPESTPSTESETAPT